MGTHTSLAPLYGYSPRGQRIFFEIPRNRGANTTLLSSMSSDGMGPSMTVEGSMTKEVFESYVEHFLAPALLPGQVVVMDNLTAHKGERVRELIEGKGCEPLYLPPYSPDFNPIEEAFSKIKGVLRKAEARTREDRKSTRLNSSHANISYAVFCLNKNHKYVITFHLFDCAIEQVDHQPHSQ